ncbi:thermonuclease family protein [Govanella unica]|uniref:Thermonuclease family protein n=1 Tax=Govanella unica TaxID=2975056 RepID=A0A9X3TVL8_9PROT|nr:thermonuclease family protein [Govania unica]MDA5192539.1 thermonuclease family protein [Govania unica]
MKRFACLIPLLLLVCLGASSPLAEEAVSLTLPPRLKDIGAARVRSVVDGDTVRLEDGRQVRLVGTQAPKLPLGRKDFKAWPLGDESKALLERLLLGRAVTLHAGGAEMDRHGRVLAHLLRDDGLWVQGAMVEAGMARVYSFPDNRVAVAELLALETAARTARRGIWADPYYAVRTDISVARHVGGYELVEGRVLHVTTVKGRSYLNFGSDYKTDFTITLDTVGRRALAKHKLKPEFFEDSVIRVRGWVSWENGPMIAVNHPEQIEILSPSESLQAALQKAIKPPKRVKADKAAKSPKGESKEKPAKRARRSKAEKADKTETGDQPDKPRKPRKPRVKKPKEPEDSL